MSGWAHVAAGAAAAGAGVVNAIAGGGTLISFPVLTALGVPSVRANATNTVSLCPGYIGGTYAQRRDLEGQRSGLTPKLVASAVGGLAGSILLVVTSEAAFRRAVPFLILAATLLLAFQDRLRRALFEHRPPGGRRHAVMEVTAIGVAAVYGGYFGAGLGIVVVAVLGLFSDLPFTRLNAVKQLISFTVNIFAAGFLVFSGKVAWSYVAVMAPAALAGGNLGGRLAGVLKPILLRRFVVVLGLVVTAVYFAKT
jgi:uncharacterized membrane protein YfcA